MLNPRILGVVDVLAQPAERLVARDHLARVPDRNGRILVAVEDEDLLVRGVLGDRRRRQRVEPRQIVERGVGRFDHAPEVGDGADGRQRGEQLGVAEANRPGPAAPHREAGERDPFGVDRVGAANVGDHPHDVVVAEAVVAHQLAAAERRDDERRDVGERELVARGLRVGLARPVVEPEHPPQVVLVVGERAVQRDDQRPGAGAASSCLHSFFGRRSRAARRARRAAASRPSRRGRPSPARRSPFGRDRPPWRPARRRRAPSPACRGRRPRPGRAW